MRTGKFLISGFLFISLINYNTWAASNREAVKKAEQVKQTEYLGELAGKNFSILLLRVIDKDYSVFKYSNSNKINKQKFEVKYELQRKFSNRAVYPLRELISDLKNIRISINGSINNLTSSTQLKVSLDDIDVLQLLLILAKLTGKQYFVDENLLYKPTFITLKGTYTVKQLEQILISKIREYNPWINIYERNKILYVEKSNLDFLQKGKETILIVPIDPNKLLINSVNNQTIKLSLLLKNLNDNLKIKILGKERLLKDFDKLTVYITNTDALQLLLILAKLTGKQYFVDENLLYKPTFITLKGTYTVKQLEQILISKIKEYNNFKIFLKKRFLLITSLQGINKLGYLKLGNLKADILLDKPLETAKLSFALNKEILKGVSSKSEKNLKVINWSALSSYFSGEVVNSKLNIQEQFLVLTLPIDIKLPLVSIADKIYSGIKFKPNTFTLNKNTKLYIKYNGEALSLLIALLKKVPYLQIRINNNVDYYPSYLFIKGEYTLEQLVNLIIDIISQNNKSLFITIDWNQKFFQIGKKIISIKIGNFKTRVFYIKDIDILSFSKLIQDILDKYGGFYNIDSDFNAVTITAPPKALEEITNKFSRFIQSTKTNFLNKLVSKVLYLKFPLFKRLPQLVDTTFNKDVIDILKQQNNSEIFKLLQSINNYLSKHGKLELLPSINAIEITDYPENILTILDKFKPYFTTQPIKIKVTIKFVEVNKNYAKSFGFKWSFNYGGNSKAESIKNIAGYLNQLPQYSQSVQNTLSKTVSNTITDYGPSTQSSTTQSNSQTISTSSQSQAQVVNPDGSTTTSQTQQTNQQTTTTQTTTTAPYSTSQTQFSTQVQSQQTESTTLTWQPLQNTKALFNLAFVYHKLNPINLFIEAGESMGLSKTLTSPSLIALNGQETVLEKGIEIPYQVTDQNGAYHVEYKQATLQIKVQPLLLPDGKILVNLTLSKDQPLWDRTVNGEPSINKLSITQSLILNDGSAAVISGILEKNYSKAQSGLPGLMNIPLLGWLFKTKDWNNSQDELLIIVTAKVISK
jgi:type II secretory pathway component GspD/PulD (secretin)